MDYCSFHISLSKAFWRQLFYYLLFRAKTFRMCVNVFYISSWIRQKMRNFPIDPHYKMSIDMTLQKWAIFMMGVYGENICLSSDQAEILFRVI